MNIAELLLQFAPKLIEGLVHKGVPVEHATSAVHSTVIDVATSHEQSQDAKLDNLEARVKVLEDGGP